MKKKVSSAQQPTTVARTSKMGFAKGQPDFIVESPDGAPWVMQAYSLMVDPNLTHADLQTLGTNLEHTPGGKYRVRYSNWNLIVRR